MKVLLKAIVDKVVGVFLAPFKNRDSNRDANFSRPSWNGRIYNYDYFRRRSRYASKNGLTYNYFD